MNRLLIIDGHNLLFQMFFGMPARITGRDGKAIQGVVGFIGALGKLISQVKPTHLCVMFDGEKNNPRKEILKEYKANRIDYSEVAEEENPFTQLPHVYNALSYLGIKHCETRDCETDDVIATYALRYGDENEICISSYDSDYFQLINENVRVIRYRGTASVICDERYVKEKYGVAPQRYLDYKCLVGDSADNISGIRGVGPKTASLLVNTYGGIDEILRRTDEIEKEKLRSSIKEGEEILKRNLSLIRLDGGAEIPFPLSMLKYEGIGIRTMDVIREIGLL